MKLKCKRHQRHRAGEKNVIKFHFTCCRDFVFAFLHISRTGIIVSYCQWHQWRLPIEFRGLRHNVLPAINRCRCVLFQEWEDAQQQQRQQKRARTEMNRETRVGNAIQSKLRAPLCGSNDVRDIRCRTMTRERSKLNSIAYVFSKDTELFDHAI